MSDKFKNSKIAKAMKDPKVSRALYITLVVLLVAVAVVVGITAAANRNKRPIDPPAVTNTDGNSAKVTPAPGTNTEKPSTDQKPSEQTPVESKLPDFSLPASGKVIKYHDAKLQVFSTTMNDYRVHLGVDIATASAAPVYCAADGVVKKVWKDPMMGYTVAVEHSGDAVTYYKNLDETLAKDIKEGAKIKAGAEIGKVGESAMAEIAEEPHLHFEMTVGGKAVDPLEYFTAADRTSLSVDRSYED